MLDDGRERSLDRQVVTLWRIGGAVSAAVVTLATLIGMIVFFFNIEVHGWLRLAAGAAWLVVALLLWVHALFWPGIRYRHYRYRVQPDSLEIRRGVVWRSWIHVPRSRVQHTDVSRGPLERLVGLATLIVYTAGTEHASITLGGLTSQDAVSIRDHLIPRGAEDAV